MKAVAATPGGGTACVEVRNARLRAMVVAELRSLSIDVIARDGQRTPDVLVLDDAADLNGDLSQTAVVLLSASAPGRDGVLAIGERPSPQMIREALGKVAGGRKGLR